VFRRLSFRPIVNGSQSRSEARGRWRPALVHQAEGSDQAVEALARSQRAGQGGCRVLSSRQGAPRMRRVGASPGSWEGYAGRLALQSLQNALSESWCSWAVSPPAFPGPIQVGQSRSEGRGPLLALIPWMSRRCLILSALPFGSYEKGETVRPVFRARIDGKPTEVSCCFLSSLRRTSFATTRQPRRHPSREACLPETRRGRAQTGTRLVGSA
jgi:hypothetical protein